MVSTFHKASAIADPSREQTRAPKNGHEVGVATPARDNVKNANDPATRTPAGVPRLSPMLKPLCFHRLTQKPLGMDGQLPQLQELRFPLTKSYNSAVFCDMAPP